jgi:PKD repeat protein
VESQTGSALTPDNAPNSAASDGDYELSGNAFCANAAPTAVLSGSPTSGPAPLTVNFNASGSSDPDSGDGIASYTFRFGDGSTPVTQSTPTLSHSYANPGTYHATLTVTDSRGLQSNNLASVDIQVTGPPDLKVTNITTGGNQAREGEKVTVTATVRNDGGAGAGPSSTEFRLDNTTILGRVSTPALGAGGNANVSIQWDTRGIKGNHTLYATADAALAVTESNENNNTSSLPVTVQGNKVKNGSFEQSNSGSGPDGWSGSSTGAGNASWSDGGSDGSKSAATSGNGGNAATSGSPSWTSDPIAVAPGEVLTLTVSVQSLDASSAASAGLVYLGAAGNVLSTVNLITAPLTSTAFTKLEQTVTIPAGVAQLRVKLVGFAPTDLRTAGTVRFDQVGLFGN